jgi:F0F1-type ATP synthase assembly protein I
MPDPTPTENKSNSSNVTEPIKHNDLSVGVLAGALVGLALGVLTNLIANWLQRDVLRDTFTPLSLFIIFALTLFGIVLGALFQVGRLQGSAITWPPNRRTYQLLSLLVVVLIVISAVISIIIRRTPVVYLVIDATVKMQPIFNDVRREVRLSTDRVPRDVKFGLRTYGGSADDISNCQDTEQLLPLNSYGNIGDRMDAVLARLQPRGNGSLVGAVLEAIFTDLKDESDPVQLIVVTSGTDVVCDPPGGGILEKRAKDVRGNLEVIIVSIGELDGSAKQILDSYAEAFHGRHISVASAESLPIIVERAAYYGYGYYDNSVFLAVPTASATP